MNSTGENEAVLLARYYTIIVPLLMFGLIMAITGNLYLLLCIRWIRKPTMTANLRLSLSLAVSDLWAACLLLLGLIFNNVIPRLMGIWFGKWSVCFLLVLELLRVSGLITSAAHLLALALNHCFSIVSPFKYQIMVTPAFSYVCIAFLWLSPIVINFLVASSYEGDGFRTSACEIGFYFRFWFRLGIFLQFIIPLLIMLLIYSYIVITLSTARRRCLLSQSSFKVSNGDSSHLTKDIPRRLSGHRSGRNQQGGIVSENGKEAADLHEQTRKQSDGRVSVISVNRLKAVKSKSKAITTSLLIVGTFVVGWMPAVSVFLLICFDCLFTQPQFSRLNLLTINTLVNAMIVAKLVLNPFIYAYRLVEIRYALWVMHTTRFGRRPLDINKLPEALRRLAPSISAK